MSYLRRAAILLALSLVGAPLVFAQGGAPSARKVDEFSGEVGYEDLFPNARKVPVGR